MNPNRLLIVLALLSGLMGCADAPDSELIGSAQAVAQRGKINFFHDLSTGYQLAEKRNVPCLLFFTADWCTFCHKMEETAFADAAVATLAKDFVCVLVDADRDADFCQQFGVSGYPTIQFVSPDGHRLHSLTGLQSADDVAQGMRMALKRSVWLASTVRERR